MKRLKELRVLGLISHLSVLLLGLGLGLLGRAGLVLRSLFGVLV